MFLWKGNPHPKIYIYRILPGSSDVNEISARLGRFLGVHQAHMSKTLGRFRLKPESVECLKKKRTNHGGLNYHIFKKHPRWLFGWCFPWRQSSPKSGYENLLFHEQI